MKSTSKKPSPREFRALLKKARKQARNAGMKKPDVANPIRKV